MIMRQCIEWNPKHYINLSLDYCCKNGVKSSRDFKAVLQEYNRQQPVEKQQPALTINPLTGAVNTVKLSEPAKSNIQDYETLLQNQPACR
jgi:hypothetical protein